MVRDILTSRVRGSIPGIIGRPSASDWGARDARLSAPRKCRPPPQRPHVPEDLRADISQSGIFDERWYRSRHTPAFDDDIIADYLHACGDGHACDPGPLFSSRYYLGCNCDISGINPLVHFVRYGINEGRSALCPSEIGAFFTENGFVMLTAPRNILDPRKPVVVLVWTDGNFFFPEIVLYTPCFLEAVMDLRV